MPPARSPSSAPIARAARLVADGIGRAVNIAVDMALPHRCAGCGVIVASDAGWCPDCWLKLDFLGPPACARCAMPLPVAAGPDALCGGCIADPPPWHRVHAPLAYGALTRGLAMRLKYGRRTGAARLMARMIAGVLPPVDGDDPPLLVPVPLHRWRLWSRGFNQSAHIAAALAKRTGLLQHPMALERTRHTAPLRGMGRKARARAVRGAFRLPHPARAMVAGRTVWLVDDVLTSGATAAACARALLRGGAARVDVLAFARVINAPDPADIDSIGTATDM